MLNLLKFDILGNNRSGPSFDRVRGDLKGVKGALAGVNDYARRTGRSMRNIGAGLSAGVTAPIMLMGKQSLRLYQTQAEAEAKVEQAIRSTGGAAGFTTDQLKGMASALQGATTFGDEDILANVTAPLLTFTKIQGDVFDRAQANVLDMATLLKMDLKSASILVGKALNDPVKGVSALSRSGVQFTKEQKGMIEALVETGDVAGAQALVLKELETQFKGQAAALAATPLGKWDQLSNKVGDLKEELGAQIIPFLDPLADSLAKATDWFAALSPEVKRNIVVFGGIAAAVGPVVAVLGVAAMGIGTLTTALTGLGAVLLANPVGAALALIAGGAYLIYRNWEGISGWFAGKWAAIKSGVSAGWEGIKSLLLTYTPAGFIYENWGAISGWFAGKWATIKADAVTGWEAIKAVFSQYSASELLYSMWGSVGTWFTTQWYAVIGSITLKWQEIKTLLTSTYGVDNLVKNAWRGIGAWFGSLSDSAVQGFVTIWEAIKAEVSTWPDKFVEIGAAIIDGLKQGIIQKWDGMRAWFGGLFGGLIGTTKEKLDSHSPSREFMKIGHDVVDGLALGLAQQKDKAVDEIKGIAGAMADAGQTMAQKLGPMFSGALKSIIDGSKRATEAVRDLANQLLSMALDRTIQMLFDQLFSAIGGAIGAPAAAAAAPSKASGPALQSVMGVSGKQSRAQSAAQAAIAAPGVARQAPVLAPARGPAMKVEINNNAANDVEVSAEPSPSGGLAISVNRVVSGSIQTGGLDRAMRERYGLRPRVKGR